jgi:glycosyltransferase involved in cell wall biosynthesis
LKILWIPHAGRHIPQRAHIFCQALAAHHEVHVTDWVADFTRPRDFVSIRYLRNFYYRRYRDGNITVHGIPRLAPALFSPALRQLNTRLFERVVARIIKTYGIDVVVGTFVVPPPQAPRLIFDLFDDNVSLWRSYGLSTAYADEILATEQAYLDLADATFAASSVLVDLARQRSAKGRVYWLPNAVDIVRFSTPEAKKHVPLEVGLIGNHDRLTEMEKVLAAAQALPEYIFRIAGRGRLIPSTQDRVKKLGLSNIIFDGPIRIDANHEWMQNLDVGLCPYAKTPGADATSPMRLLQYSAAGLPVVCTDLMEVRRMNFDNVILVEDSPDALVDGIHLAARMPKVRPSQVWDYDLPRLMIRCEQVLRGDPI